MRSLHQPQQRCTAQQHRWSRSAVAQVRSAPRRRLVTASAFDLNFNLGGLQDEDKAPAPKLPGVLQLPKTARRSRQSVLDAQTAAEAAQQELLATGPLAEAAAAGNELVADILSAYSSIQYLYHKAIQALLLRHPHYTDSCAGACYLVHICAVLGNLVC